MSALAVLRSSFGTSLARYRRSRGLWLLLLVAPVSARYWIADKGDASAAVVLDGAAPVLTSAVLGISLGIVFSLIFLPVAFIYLRSNTTRRQPWQIEETTAASRIAIVVGRYGADMVILGVVLVLMNLAGCLLAWMLGPTDGVRLFDISVGLWLIAAPSLMGVAALRMLFDSLRATRGVWGDVLILFLWLLMLVALMSSLGGNRSFAGTLVDFSGIARPVAYSLPPEQAASMSFGNAPASANRFDLDVKAGLSSPGYLTSRLIWAGLAIAFVILAGIVYRPHRPEKRARFWPAIASRFAARSPPACVDAPAAPLARSPLPGMFVAEFRLIALGRIWLLLAGVVALLGWTSDFHAIANPALLLLLIFGMSAQAGRSEQRGLLALTSTTPVRPNARRAVFVAAGIVWSLLLALPAIVRASSSHDLAPLLVTLGTGTFVAFASTLLATWSHSAVAPRLILLMAWYAWISQP